MSVFNNENNMKTFKFRYLLLVVSLSFSSCSDFLEEDTRGQQMQETFYNTDSELEGGLIGIYEQIINTDAGIKGNLIYRNEACSDLLTYKPAAAAAGMAFPKYMLTPESNLVTNTWNHLYSCIFGINAYIQAVENNTSSKVSIKVKDICLKEAKFFRALMYYHLVMCWGDVPLRTKPTDMSNTDIERTPKDKIWEVVLSDLNEAITLPDKTEVENGRISKGAALYLLAKVHLMRGDMKNAQNVLNQITGYSLMSDIKHVWSTSYKYNDESIWEINREKGTLPKQGNDMLGYYMPMHKDFKGVNSTYPVNDYVLMMTEKESDRTKYYYSKKPLSSEVSPQYKGEYTYVNSNGEDVKIIFSNATVPLYSHIMKFADFSMVGYEFAVGDCPFNIVLFRYADVVLMQAEVECELNGRTQKALDLLNKIRDRAKETPYSYDKKEGYRQLISKEELREAIRNERALELIGEGHRFYDLKRWGSEYALRKLKESRKAHIEGTEFCYRSEDLINIKEEYLLWPIPESEINANNKITQNPGYK